MRASLRARQGGRVRVGTVLLLLCVAVGAAAFCDLGFLVRGRVDRAAARAEAALGRPVRVRGVRLHLLPEVALDLEGARVESPGAPPLLSIEALRVRARAWPLLRSLGRELRVRLVEADGVELDLARLPDGRPQLADALARLQRELGPLDPERRTQLLQGGVERAVLRAALRCPEAEAGALGQVTLTAEELRAGSSPRLRLEAGQKGQAPGLRLGVDLGPLPSDGELEPLTLLRAAELRLARLPLRGLRCLAGDRVPAAGAVEQADLTIELPAMAGRLRVRGAARVAALPRGDLGLRVDLEADPLAGDVQAKALELTLGPASLRGAADLRRLWLAPEVHHLELRSEGLRLEDLLALAGRPGEGDGARPRPASLRLQASGPPKEARLAAELAVPDVGPQLSPALAALLGREAGLPLSAELRGRLAPLGLDLDRLALRLGPASVTARGRLRARRVSLTIEDAALDRALLAEALPRLGPELRALPGEGRVGLGGTIDVELGGALRGAITLSPPGRPPLVALHLGGTMDSPEVARVERLGPGLLDRARELLPGDGPRPGGLRERLRERLLRR